MDLKQARTKMKMTQIALAEKTGLSQTAISNIETGFAYPREITRKKIEDVLGVEVDWMKTRMQPETATRRGKLMWETGDEEAMIGAIRDWVKSGGNAETQARKISFLRSYLNKFEKALIAERKAHEKNRRRFKS